MLSRKVFNSLDKYVYEHNLKYHEAKALKERALLDFRVNWTDSYKSLKHDFDESINTLAELSNKTCKDVRLQIEQMYTQMQQEIQSTNKGDSNMNLDRSVKVGSSECPIRKVWVLESGGMFMSADRTWGTINNALIFQDLVPAQLAGKLILEIPVCRSGRTDVSIHEMYEVRVGDFAIRVKQEPTPGFRTFYGVYKFTDRSAMVNPGDLLRLTNWCNNLDGWDEIKESAPVIHLP